LAYILILRLSEPQINNRTIGIKTISFYKTIKIKHSSIYFKIMKRFNEFEFEKYDVDIWDKAYKEVIKNYGWEIIRTNFYTTICKTISCCFI
jgi:hypothetical protein